MPLQVKGLLAAALAIAFGLAAGAGQAQPEPAPQTAQAGPSAAGQPIPAPELEAFVDGVAADALARDHIAGAVVSVVQNGQVLLQKGYGVDRLSPARPVDPARTLFRLGGVTQSFTWVLLMREVEAGHIRLNAPINLYLPQGDQIKDQGYKRPVMVRDLLGHAGGFETRVYGQAVERNPDRIRALDVYLRQEQPRRVREAGVTPGVSAYDAALAGEAITQASGYTMQSLLESRIAGPLGMSRTTLREPYPARRDLPAPMPQALADDSSQGFRWTGSGFAVRPYEYMTQAAPAASGSSTAQDMGRFMLAILGEGAVGDARIYSPDIAKDFRTTLIRSAPGVRGWDYGLLEYALPGGYWGQGQEGETLSFRANMVTVPTLGLGVFVAANTETGASFARALPAQIVRRFYAHPVAPGDDGSDWLKANANAFQGRYLTTLRAYHGLEKFADLLAGSAPVDVTADGVLLTPGPHGPLRWTPESGASLDAQYVRFRQIGGAETLMFEMRDGRAVRWFAPAGGAAFQRAGPLTDATLLIVLGIIVAIAAIAAVGGLFLRDRRDFRQTTVQARANGAQVSGSALWLSALLCFCIWRGRTADPAVLAYDWPGAWLLVASSSALIASVMTLTCLVLLPVAWRGGRRLDSWTPWRKARFTFTAVVFALFAILLGLWGALEPWRR